MQKFDYSMYEEKPHWSSECLSDPKYWGIHLSNEELVVDVQRYKKTFESIGNRRKRNRNSRRNDKKGNIAVR